MDAKQTFLTCLLTGLMSSSVACTIVQRHANSGYAGYDNGSGDREAQEFYKDRRDYEFDQARAELGFERNNLSRAEEDRIWDRVALKRLERSLETRAEKQQYYHYRGFLPTDQDRIDFLKQKGIAAREAWIKRQGFPTSEEKLIETYSPVIEENDIALGMPRQAVRQSWGEPEAVEVAGNPVYGNERWVYQTDVSSDDGFSRQTRVLYFESGRLAGWERHSR